MTMDTSLPLSASSDMDDLPRTLRRERDRQRAASSMGSLGAASRPAGESVSKEAATEDLVPSTVKRFDVPFFRLMTFFLKAVVAAIPALILLTAILGIGGHLLQVYFPELVQTKIIICSPDNPKGC